MSDLVPGGEDVADPVTVAFGVTAGNIERGRHAVPIQQVEEQRDGDLRAVGALRQHTRPVGVGRILAEPHLLGVEVERDTRRKRAPPGHSCLEPADIPTIVVGRRGPGMRHST